MKMLLTVIEVSSEGTLERDKLIVRRGSGQVKTEMVLWLGCGRTTVGFVVLVRRCKLVGGMGIELMYNGSI
jgi:hypothetical protein